MRRKDREVSDKKEIIAIINRCDLCRLALAENNQPYIVPMNFGYSFENEQLIIYFHGAHAGKKLDIIRQNPNACFEMDCSTELIKGKQACDYSMAYESVIGNGVIEFISDKTDKIYFWRIFF